MRASYRSLRRASWSPCLAAPSLTSLPGSCPSACSCIYGMQAFPPSKSLTQRGVYSSRNSHAATGSPQADTIHAPPRGPMFCPVSAQADVPPKLVQLMIAAGQAVTMDGAVSSSFMPAEDRGLMPTVGTFPSVCTCPRLTDGRHRVLGFGCWALGGGPWVLGIGCWALSAGH